MEDITRIDRILRHEGAIVDVYEDVVKMPTGKTVHWDFVSHRKGAAAVVPVLDDGRILMVSQYRNALDKVTLEIPAGSRNDKSEETIICAARELEEETGYRSRNLTFLIQVCTSVAFCDECIDIFVAENLEKTAQNLDEDEFVDVQAYSLEELCGLIYSGKITDSKTVSAILAYKVKMQAGGTCQ